METTILLKPNFFNGFKTSISWEVEQFGFATIPLCHFKSSSLTPAITSGTSFSIRKADELSIIIPPRLTISGAYFWLVELPAEASTISTPLNESGVVSSTVYSLP